MQEGCRVLIIYHWIKYMFSYRLCRNAAVINTCRLKQNDFLYWACKYRLSACVWTPISSYAKTCNLPISRTMSMVFVCFSSLNSSSSDIKCTSQCTINFMEFFKSKSSCTYFHGYLCARCEQIAYIHPYVCSTRAIQLNNLFLMRANCIYTSVCMLHLCNSVPICACCEQVAYMHFYVCGMCAIQF